MCSAPDVLCLQSSLPAQPPTTDVTKVRSKESVTTLVKRLRSTWVRCNVGASKDQNFLFLILLRNCNVYFFVYFIVFAIMSGLFQCEYASLQSSRGKKEEKNDKR